MLFYSHIVITNSIYEIYLKFLIGFFKYNTLQCITHNIFRNSNTYSSITYLINCSKKKKKIVVYKIDFVSFIRMAELVCFYAS